MSTKIITVVGITGNQGASVAEAFINQAGWKVRGISRDPTKASGKAWSNRGVDMVAADLGDVEALKTAFKGSNVIYGVTDFWAQMKVQANLQKAKETGKTINQISYGVEVQQGKNLVDAAQATADTLDILVLSVLTDSVKWSQGKITGNYHFEAKWRTAEYLEKTYPELYKKTSFFQPASFTSGLDLLFKPRQMPDGSYVLSVPVDDDVKIPWYDANKDTGTLVKALVESPPGKNLMACGSWASINDIAQVWEGKLGQKVQVKRGSADDFDKIIPGGGGRELGDMCEYMSSPGYYGGEEAAKALNLISPSDLGSLKLVSYKDAIEKLTL